MKKTKHIQLVLITAALSSCSRVIIPNEPLQGCLADTSLSRTPVDWDENREPAVQPYYEISYAPSWNFGFYYRPVVTHAYLTPQLHPGRWGGGENPPPVVRGGFGLSAKTVTIAS